MGCGQAVSSWCSHGGAVCGEPARMQQPHGDTGREAMGCGEAPGRDPEEEQPPALQGQLQGERGLKPGHCGMEPVGLSGPRASQQGTQAGSFSPMQGDSTLSSWGPALWRPPAPNRAWPLMPQRPGTGALPAKLPGTASPRLTPMCQGPMGQPSWDCTAWPATQPSQVTDPLCGPSGDGVGPVQLQGLARS